MIFAVIPFAFDSVYWVIAALSVFPYCCWVMVVVCVAEESGVAEVVVLVSLLLHAKQKTIQAAVTPANEKRFFFIFPVLALSVFARPADRHSARSDYLEPIG